MVGHFRHDLRGRLVYPHFVPLAIWHRPAESWRSLCRRASCIGALANKVRRKCPPHSVRRADSGRQGTAPMWLHRSCVPLEKTGQIGRNPPEPAAIGPLEGRSWSLRALASQGPETSFGKGRRAVDLESGNHSGKQRADSPIIGDAKTQISFAAIELRDRASAQKTRAQKRSRRKLPG